MMEYKGYIGITECDEQAAIIHGEVINTRDVVTFQGTSVAEIKKAFHESVDDYLAFCKARGESPDKPFSGQFVTRVSPGLHRQVSLAAVISGKSLNAWVVEQIQDAVARIGAIKAAPVKKSSGKAPRRAVKKIARKKSGTRRQPA